jgi:UDP-N-acetylmuramyl pentapeptide synthase
MFEHRSQHVISQAVSLSSDLFERVKPVFKKLYKGPLLFLAFLYRRLLSDIVFIGVTGSCGKTTTKDLIDAALGQQLRGSKSQDSNNRLYSVTRTVLSLRPWSHYCVQELGVSKPGSLDQLLRLLRPSIGVIINIGSDHYRAFRTIEATAREKGKLLEHLPKAGTAVLNADDPNVLALASRCKGQVVTFGHARDSMVRAQNVSSAWPARLSLTVSHQSTTYPVRTRLCGVHWAPAVLAALATAVAMRIPLDVAIKGVEQTEPWLGRMFPVQLADGTTFVRDDWKASFWSMPTALEFLRTASAARKIAIIGTLSDYGGTASQKYKSIAKHALEVADYVFFVGKHANSALRLAEEARENRLRAFTELRTANNFVQDFLREGDLVLVKGSNSDHLARIPLARQRRVDCWRMNCRRNRVLCDRCSLLRGPFG